MGSPSPTSAAGDAGVRRLQTGDLAGASRRQVAELPDGFFTGLGPRFVERYLQTFLDGPAAVALTVERRGEPVGHLVGTVGPGHSSWVLRTRWRSLLPAALLGLARRPDLLVLFLRTRSGRYTRAALRAVRAGRGTAASGPAAPPAGGTPPSATGPGPAALLHVAVDPGHRGTGAGAALVLAFEQRARQAGCGTARLVTFAGDAEAGETTGAGAFYERLGWTRSGQRVDDAGRLVLTYGRTL